MQLQQQPGRSVECSLLHSRCCLRPREWPHARDDDERGHGGHERGTGGVCARVRERARALQSQVIRFG